MIAALQAAGHDPLLGGEGNRVVTYAAYGAAYSVLGFLNSRAKRGADVETFSPAKFVQPVIIGAIAGVIVATSGQEATAVNLDAAMAVAIPMANQLINMAKMTGKPPVDEYRSPTNRDDTDEYHG